MSQVKYSSRVVPIDSARTLALIAMAIYHFSWDLEFFGFLPSGYSNQLPWRLFARCIASSFLILAGFSLVLAHRGQVKWKPFWFRFAKIGAAALLVSVATFYATPQNFVYFGILHSIALASLLGVLLLRAHWAVLAVLISFVIAFPLVYSDNFFAQGSLLLFGLASNPPPSNDYVPLFPWFSAFLAGMIFGKFSVKYDVLDWLSGNKILQKIPQWFAFPGRHSLIVYLIHQPILIGLLWVFVQISPPRADMSAVVRSCQVSCQETDGEQFCFRYCSCVVDELKNSETLNAVLTRTATSQQTEILNQTRRLCGTRAK